MQPLIEPSLTQLLPTGKLSLSIENQLFSLDSLMGFAARANNKRGFLFLSKVLGKHWPVKPSRMKEIHDSLASQIPSNLPEPIIFVAMAETAVGLGQGVYESYKKNNPEKSILFIHTTRYHIIGHDLIEFEEAHSHAPRQFIHMPNDQVMRNKLLSAQSVVMIDDEASTGNTFLNLKNALLKINPNIKNIHLCTITNFMGSDKNSNLSNRFELDVSIGSSLTGEYLFAKNDYVFPEVPAQKFKQSIDRGASCLFGRTGIDKLIHINKNLLNDLVDSLPKQAKILVLGTGEFMHAAFRLGLELEQQGFSVFVQSTTRSPILEWGDVTSKLEFDDNYGEGISNFVYNLSDRHYDKIFICHETPPNEALQTLAKLTNGELLHFTKDNYFEKNTVC